MALTKYAAWQDCVCHAISTRHYSKKGCVIAKAGQDNRFETGEKWRGMEGRMDRGTGEGRREEGGREGGEGGSAGGRRERGGGRGGRGGREEEGGREVGTEGRREGGMTVSYVSRRSIVSRRTMVRNDVTRRSIVSRRTMVRNYVTRCST